MSGKLYRGMERAPTPSSLAVIAASAGDVPMDTPLSPKRPRSDDVLGPVNRGHGHMAHGHGTSPDDGLDNRGVLSAIS
eukprot:scaffold151289_cov30-Tisochrysis_lutea.AAC.3